MKKILVVDNHPVMLKFMTNLLEKEGCSVLTAGDGLSALDTLETYLPDVVFVDLVMPNIDGEKLCRIIRGTPRLKDVFLVILSGIAAEEDIDLTEFGADACIAKGPFEKMRKQILGSLFHLECGTRAGPTGERKAEGFDDIHPRDIGKELLSVKRHLETVLKSMSEGILEITSGGRVVFANPAALFLIGRLEEELLGSDFVGLFSGTDCPRIKDMLEMVENGPQSTSEGAPVILKGKHISLNMVSLQGTDHKTVVILNDVSERKKMEAQLLHAQKMEAIGTLAGGVAHDFNNLLLSIQGNTSLMLLDLESTHPYYERLKSIENQVQSGSKLTAQLLGCARKGNYEVAPIDLNHTVKQTSATFGRTKKEVSIHGQFAEDLSPIEADQGQIEQVLLNLYINAWQAMPGGGDLFLKTMNITHEEMKDNFGDVEPGSYVLLTVTDTGTGMDKETLEHIFDPFFTTKEMSHGTGLGLASVYGIVKNHGGRIHVESEKGDGTIFKILFPATEKETIRTHKEQQPAEICRGTETVLLVDDEDVVIDVGEDMLAAMGYSVLSARSGKEALDVYEEKKEDVNIVILDMIMPGMTGGETYERMKQINPHVKVLLSSGYSAEGRTAQILRCGCNGFLQKPFNMEDLYRGIRDVLDGQ